ncbi:MAG: hypothetical protein [Microviridae sp.]|nr:MAG: hypothetical protein [Microviridae sp.]
MSTSQREQLQSQMNAKKALNLNLNSKIIDRRQIENSPFWEVTTDEGRYIVMGKHRLTENLSEGNKEKPDHGITAEAYIEENKWTIILQLVCCVITDIKQNSL